ncbi:MAG: protein-export chaperone SecB [Acidiferrobacteraceae bacterium]|jgi:preprotein translocase subunit SecB|nr:protein-export chaperone SecB [Acidiferrobacteraceae bacterium]MCP4829907.1 protein-export chaperone SecB [Pseudomonadota bacterium]MDP6950284.1 protein-export chaperone SecB [Arenicellales bacterium]HJP07120.1 protein-export chaperone SecB [Arenicellales bacterium]|tara:strand:+ start:3136 stop:3636 length:501 start_codon:yes stop_codon:yes gene_type:complete
MTDTAVQTPKSIFQLHQVFVKDSSFESPQSPDIFTWKEYRPETEVDLKAQHHDIDADQHLHEVILRATVTSRHDDQIIFLAEVQQAGVFTVQGSTPEIQEMMLEAACPNVLFPFLRETVAGLISKGGFPQFLLGPVNFDAMYLQKKEQAAQKAAEDNGAGVPVTAN